MSKAITEITDLLTGADELKHREEKEVNEESDSDGTEEVGETDIISEESDMDEVTRQLQLGALADLMVDEFEAMISSIETIKESILTMKKVLGIDELQKALKDE